MGRPKKEQAATGAQEDGQEVEQETTEAGAQPADVIKMEDTPPVDLKHLKRCPKCGDDATGPYKDKHGLYRCNCSHPKCGFWDSMVWLSPEEAARSWQLAGGPNPPNE